MKMAKVLLAISMTALFAAQPALADSLTFNGFYESGTPTNYTGTDTVHIYDTAAPAFGEYVYSGGFSMKDTTGAWTMGGVTTGKNVSFMAWCIDVYDNMNSASYTLKEDEAYVPSSHVPLNTTRIEALERLASNDLGLVHDAKTSSAFQLAAWEIMAEKNSSTYSLGNGNFYASGDALGAITQANTWLSNLGTATPKMELYIWRADRQGSTQDLAVFAPIPEPETYAMLLAGLGLMGITASRRKKRVV